MSTHVPYPDREELEADNARLREQLAEAEQALDAIQSGMVDALVIDSAEGQRIFSLSGAERPYRALIEQMAEGAVTLSREGVIQYCNRAFASLLSRPLETIMGQMLFEHVQEDYRAPLALLLTQVQRASVHGELQLTALDAPPVPVMVNLTLLPDSATESVGLVFTDLTERKQAERASSSAEFVRGLIEKAPLGIAVVDEHLRYVLANPIYQALADGRLEIGRPVDEASAPEVVRVIHPLVARVLDSRETLTVPESRIAGMSESWWTLNLVPLLDSQEHTRSVLILTEEITERKRAEDGIRLSERHLKDADRRKDEFLATLAHELRNPLAPIRTASQLLASPKLSTQQLQWVQMVIQRQVGHMALLLDDLLDVARITRGKLTLNVERVTLTSVVDAAVEVVRPLLDAKNHTFIVSLPAEVVFIDADPLRLAQIISNLLTNAAKYTDPAGHIEMTALVKDRELWLTVKDNGIGIAPESLNRIFEMFSQVESALARSEGGLGIGLALVKGLVVLHGGGVEVHSAGAGSGSEFTLRLPLSAHQTPVTVANESHPSALALYRRRVLVVDDNKDAADALALLLELSGHEVRVAYSGRVGLSLAQTFRPDIALLDIGMPDINGYDLAQTMRRSAWATDIRLVALTGWGQEDDRQQAKRAGFDGHLTKPVDPAVLESLVSACR